VGRHGPLRSSPTRRASDLVARGGAVALVAAQAADDAQGVAGEVLEAEAVFAGPLQFGANGERERTAGEQAIEGPARIEAGVVAIEVDHAAATAGRELRGGGNRQHLPGLALPGMQAQREHAEFAGILLETRAGLLLAHRLAGVEGQRPGAGRARVL